MTRRTLPVRAPLAGVALVLMGCVLVGCGSSAPRKLDALPDAVLPSTTSAAPAPTQATTTTVDPAGRYTVATVKGKSVGIYNSPLQTEPDRVMTNEAEYGSDRVFLVQESKGSWYNVLLPGRPNGSTGWVRADEVVIAHHDFRIEVELGAHRLTVWKGDDVFLQETVAVGAKATPTAQGTFYTTELVASNQPAYGPFAYPLSGYSEVLFEFGGGDGQMGIHGTNDPSSLGKSISNGCIRMSNAAITKLANTLPVGVPVEIKA